MKKIYESPEMMDMEIESSGLLCMSDPVLGYSTNEDLEFEDALW